MEDNKVWNSKMDYAMDLDLNDAMDSKVKEILKGTKIGKGLLEPDEEDCRYAVFDSAVFDLVEAAKDEYCEGETKLDEILDMLIEAFTKLKGKEEALKKICMDDAEDDEEEEEEDEK